jgi:hypothetical protein
MVMTCINIMNLTIRYKATSILVDKTSNEKIYWDGIGNICNFLYKSRHESRLPEFVITLIMFFVFY